MHFTTIAFDADDTLWENEPLYQHAQEMFRQLLSPWQTVETINDRLFATEMHNLQLYGYGIKAFALSMVETAIQLSEGEISSEGIQAILDLTREMLTAEVQLHPHVEETLRTLSASYPLMLITMGDLLDQTAKIERSGLSAYFTTIEILNQKTDTAYEELLNRHRLDPKAFLMVGNSLRSDVVPVLALGGSVVHIPANTSWAHDHIDAFDPTQPGYYSLDDIGLLTGLVARLDGNSRSE